MLLMDSEGDPPCELAPRLLAWAQAARPDADIFCVLAHPMFGVWFAACAVSLAGYNGLPAELTTPESPEGRGLGKGWLQKQLPRKYREPIDQRKFVSKMDIGMCRANAPSFDKLCRELERRLPAPPPGNAGAESPEQGGGQ
jgi:hypothetical protein